jgi:hypothetical protein
MVVPEVVNPQKRYLKPVFTPGVQNAAFDGVTTQRGKEHVCRTSGLSGLRYSGYRPAGASRIALFVRPSPSIKTISVAVMALTVNK